MAEPKVGVTVISGFLGSGKTTLLQRLVRDPVLGPKLAVIVNDLGELGLDHELIASQGSTPTLQVTSLVSGCVCCTLRSDLGAALVQLASGVGLARRPEHILIEPSGIARASEVSYAINALGFEAPVQTDAVITLVDAHNAARSHHEHPELFEDQLRAADLVLINKSELMTDPTARAALEAKVAQLAPRATRLWCERAAVDLALLLGEVALYPRSAGPQAAAARPATLAPVRGAPPAAHGIVAVTVAVPYVVDQAALEDFLDAQADRIFRIKGVVDAASDAGVGPITVQAVGDRVELDAIDPASPLAGAPRRLIFIGHEVALGSGSASCHDPAHVHGPDCVPLPRDPAESPPAPGGLPQLLKDLARCARGGT